MRRIIILIILLFSIAFVSAGSYQKTTERFALEEGESAELNGKMLTLLNLDFDRERAIVCVNGERTILGMRKAKTINKAMLELKKVTLNKAEIRMWVNCPGCECDESCDNSVCIDECYEDKECDDGDALTEDKCYGTPKKCHNKKIKECLMDGECDDNNERTIDECSDTFECIHKVIDYKEEVEPVTGASVFQTTTKHAKNIHPLLLSTAFGFMIITILIKKFKY